MSNDVELNMLTPFTFQDDFEYMELNEQYCGLNPVPYLGLHIYIVDQFPEILYFFLQNMKFSNLSLTVFNTLPTTVKLVSPSGNL